MEPAARPAQRAARRGLAVLLAVLLVALTVAVVVLALQVRQDRQRVADRQAALQAARQQAVNLTSISHRTASQDIDRILDGATGQLAQQFRDEREQLTTLLGSTRSASEGTVLGAGLVELGDRSATVLVAADAHVITAEQATPVVQRYRMSLDLRKVGDRWLVEEILFAGPPA